MTHVNAPPPAAVGQLSDLIALIKNVDAVAQIVADLQKATEDYHEERQALAVANSQAVGRDEALDKREASLGKREALLAKREAAAVVKARAQAESESNLQGGYANLATRTEEFEASMAERLRAMEIQQAELLGALAQTQTERALAEQIRAGLEAKAAAVNAALGV